MLSRLLLTFIVTVVVLAALYYYLQSGVVNTNNAVGPTPTPVTQVATPTQSIQSGQESSIAVTATGFSPASLIVKVGDMVTWVNSDSASHQVNSDPHPTHTEYPPLNNIGLLGPGTQKSLTFPNPGTYGYHDHLNPQLKGTVTVE